MKRPWRVDEERILAEMWNQGRDQREIGAALGRTPLAVNSRIKQCRERLRLMPHASPALKAGQRKPIQREVEMAITRAMAMTGRRRSSIITEFKQYLFNDGKRRRRVAIPDLGGMIQAGRERAA